MHSLLIDAREAHNVIQLNYALVQATFFSLFDTKQKKTVMGGK